MLLVTNPPPFTRVGPYCWSFHSHQPPMNMSTTIVYSCSLYYSVVCIVIRILAGIAAYNKAIYAAFLCLLPQIAFWVKQNRAGANCWAQASGGGKQLSVSMHTCTIMYSYLLLYLYRVSLVLCLLSLILNV